VQNLIKIENMALKFYENYELYEVNKLQISFQISRKVYELRKGTDGEDKTEKQTEKERKKDGVKKLSIGWAPKPKFLIASLRAWGTGAKSVPVQKMS